MFARYFFILVGGLSLAWIVYVGVDIVDKTNDLSPQSLFGTEDGQLLIINRKDEFSWRDLEFSTPQQAAVQSIIANLSDEKSIIISEQREHFLIESSSYWTTNTVEQLLNQSGWKIQATHLHSIETPDYLIDFHKTHLYFHTKQATLNTTQLDDWTQFDQKASAVVVTFSAGSYALKECYFKGGNQLVFSAKKDPNIRGMQVDDNTLFAGILPQEIEDYHFIESTYLASIDKIYAQHPMATWVNHGAVQFTYKNKAVIVTDFKLGQDPISVLKDALKQDVTNEAHADFSGIQLMQGFPKTSSNTFYMYSLDDFVVMSEDKTVCEDIVAQHKLGNSLATNKNRLAYFYAGLPKSVSERVVTQHEVYSRSIYGDKVMKTRFIGAAKKDETHTNSHTTPSISMNVDEEIIDFTTNSGKGNVLALTANGKLICFKSGKRSWQKILDSKPVGTIQPIAENATYLITSEHAIHFITADGADYVSPILVSESSIAQDARFIQWKGQNMLAYLTENGTLHVLQNGKEQFTYATKLTTVASPIDCWISQNKLLVGIRDKNTFHIIDCAKKRELRTFELPSESVTTLIGNELFNFAIDGGTLTQINQKGAKSPLVALNGKLELIKDNLGTAYLVSRSKKSVSLLSLAGKLLGVVRLNFSDIEHIAILNNAGKTTVAIIDGLENNIYMYNTTGKKVSNASLEGAKKSSINTINQQSTLSTIVDNYIIQYILNV